MKRKTSLFIIGILLVCLIVGIGIYVNIMKHDSKNRMCLETKDISSTGMTLCLKWEDESKGTTLSMRDRYRIQKLTFIGWKPIHERPQMLVAEQWEDSRQYFEIWDLDWEHSVGELPFGVYRIEKEVSVVRNETEQDTVLLFAPFLCGNWWIVLGVVLAIVLIAMFVCAGKKNIINRKKKIVIGICVACMLLIGGVMIFLKYYERRFVWIDVARYMVIDEKEAEQMQIYDVSGYVWADEETQVPNNKKKIIELTATQKEDVLEVFGYGKTVGPVRRLWYRYDAVIVIDDRVEYMISTKDKIAYVNYADENEEFLGQIELSREENQILEEILKGN